MNLHARVAKLEAAFANKASDPTAPAFDVDAEMDRWEDALDLIERLLDGRADLDPVIDHFRLESVNIGCAAHLHDAGDGKGTDWLRSIQRVPGATVALFERLPAELRPVAASRDAIKLGGASGWSRSWIHNLAFLGSRLPPDLAASVMGSLATTVSGLRWGVTPPDLGVVCAACGLRRQLHSEWENCPHCKEPAWSWPGRGEENAPWLEMARRELDPPAA
jgi:hypothetical protein